MHLNELFEGIVCESFYKDIKLKYGYLSVYKISSRAELLRLEKDIFESSSTMHNESDENPLLQVIAKLRKNVLSPHIKIFGSAAHRPLLKQPNDIDAFVDITGVSEEDRRKGMRDLLALAQRYYGYFDPFVYVERRQNENGKEVIRRALWSRDERAKSWVVAKNGLKLSGAGKAGIPLEDFTLDLTERAPILKRARASSESTKKNSNNDTVTSGNKFSMLPRGSCLVNDMLALTDDDLISITAERVRAKLFANRKYPIGSTVSVRLNLNHKIKKEGQNVSILTIHRGRRPSGKVIGYDRIVTVANATFYVHEPSRASIAAGRAKFPMAAVVGQITDRPHSSEGIPLRFNPKSMKYFARVDDGRNVLSAEEVTIFNSRVYARGVIVYGGAEGAHEVI